MPTGHKDPEVCAILAPCSSFWVSAGPSSHWEETGRPALLGSGWVLGQLPPAMGHLASMISASSQFLNQFALSSSYY